jgi:hypothetical protein
MANHHGLVSGINLSLVCYTVNPLGIFSSQFIFDTTASTDDMIVVVMTAIRPIIQTLYNTMKVELRYLASSC